MLEPIRRALTRVLDAAVGGLLAAIVAITLAQVAARYLLGSSLVWSEELNRLLYVWIIFLAAVKAAHMRINLLSDWLRPSLRVVVEGFSTVLQVALLGLVVYGAYAMVELTSTDSFIGLDVSVKYMYIAPLAGSLGWMIVVIAHAFAPPAPTHEEREGDAS